MNLKQVIKYLTELEEKYGNLLVYAEYDGQYSESNKEDNFSYETHLDNHEQKIIVL